jgi:5-formyltetrahydrofolate cyclo-ligase
VRVGGEKARKRRFRIFLNGGFEKPALNLSTFEEKGFDVFREKSNIRRDLLSRRISLTPREVDKNSKEITKNLLKLKRFKNAQRIALYFPIKNEVRAECIFERAKELRKEIYFPRVEGSLLEFRKVNDLRELEPGRLGVPEPNWDSAKVEITDIDLFIIPGIAFDRLGRRLGYGKGYYDRTLAKIDKKRGIGLAYGFQVLDSIPVERGDEEVDLVVTESGVIFCKRRM